MLSRARYAEVMLRCDCRCVVVLRRTRMQALVCRKWWKERARSMSASHLYLLVFPARGMLKIGKADAVYERIQSLRRHWGDVDYAASYQLGAPVDSVFKLEKSLHFLLAEHALTLDVGDGKT